MRKGISAVVATLLLLVITIGLTSLVAGYLFGFVGRSTAKIFSVLSTDCVGGTATIVLRNEGTFNISAGEITFNSINEACATDPTGPAISAGSTAITTASGCASGRTHSYRAIGPSNTVQLTFFCA